MATRLHLGDLSGPITPTSWDSAWDRTVVGALTGTLGSPYTNTGGYFAGTAGAGVSGWKTATSRFVSPALRRQSISGFIKGQAACRQTLTTDDYTLAFALRVVKPDGAERGVLVAATASADTSATPPEMATSTLNRRLRDASGNTSITLNPVEAQDGDYLVLEIGFRQGGTSVSNCIPVDIPDMQENAGFAQAVDLPESDATTGMPWIELTNDLSFKEPYFYRSSSLPAESAAPSNATTTLTVTPPTSLRAGDLVYVFCQSRAAATWSIGVTGGQSWTSETAFDNCRIFWCTFNGTWSADPRFDSTSSTCTSAVMHCFRAKTVNDTWSVDVALANAAFAAPSTPFTVTRNGITTVADDVVAIAGFKTSDDNTWRSTSGSGWALIGEAQYRNTASTDQSCSFAAYVAPTGGTNTGNVSKNQATLGGDAGRTFIHGLKDVSPPESLIFNPAPMAPFMAM